MKYSVKALVIAALLAITAVSMAQGGGQGRGQGRGQGGMRGGGMNSPAGLVNRADVQKDIKVTDAQKAKLDEYQTKQREEQRARMEEMRNGGGGGGGFDREAMQKMMAENQAKQEKAIKEILDEKQWTRVRQIWVQLQGNRAILNAEVQKELKLDDAQVTKIKELQTKAQEANQSVMERVRNQEITREESQEINRKNNEAMGTELAKILTTEQAAALKAMGGEPFKADPPAGGGGRGGN